MNLKEIASQLNLSFSTVSKALRDSHEISAATKKLVLAKAKELNYEVNHFASSLRKQKSKTIAVIIPEVVNDFFGPAINGIESIAQEKGYHVLIYLTHEDLKKEVAITKLLQNGRVDGILISISEQTLDVKHLEEFKEKQIPLVFFDRVVEKMQVPKVTTDDYQSGVNATEHLIENGCEKISFLSITESLSISNKRLNGFLDALTKHDLPINKNLIINCPGNDVKNKNLIRDLLKRKNRPDGIFASLEKLAIDVYEVCEELNLNIPKDVKIICFSNLKTAGLLNPSMTTITQPAFEIGKEAATILFNLIEGKAHDFSTKQIIINSKLIVRNSTKKSN
jgi:LacI family transcriptional regulator